METILFTLLSNTLRRKTKTKLWNKPNQGCENLYNGNLKLSKKEIRGDTRRWKDCNTHKYSENAHPIYSNILVYTISKFPMMYFIVKKKNLKIHIEV